MKSIAITALLIGCLAAVGCTSPESTRTRGGHGADVGNRGGVVEMHDGDEPFWHTPLLVTGDHPPLESARQAEQLSRQ